MGVVEHEWFTITTKAGLKIGAVLSGDVKQLAYAGTQESSVSIKCNNDETFTITVTVAGTGYEFTLSGFKEIEEFE